MTWEIVVGLGTLLTLALAFMKPVISLTKAMTTLTVTVTDLKDSVNGTVKELKDAMSDITTKNQEGHKRIWDHATCQDNKLDNHENRITKIETKMELQEKNN